MGAKPRILVISNYNQFHSVRPEAEIWLALKKKGYDISIMTFPNSQYAQLFHEAGIHLIPFHPTKKRKTSEINKIRQTLLQGNYQQLYLYNSQAIVSGIKAAKNWKGKVVLYRGYSANISWLDPTAYFKFLHPRVDKIICNSIGVEQLFRRQKFFNTAKLITINKGHDLAWYQHIKPLNIRNELGLDSNCILFVTVANNRRMKGVPYLLKAANQFDTNKNWRLLLIGNDMDNTKNQQLLQAEETKKRVIFMGFRADALAIVANCDAFILPSIKGESITKSVIEAMALGVAPIISDIAGNQELVVHQQNGLVFPAKNAQAISQNINSVLKNPKQLAVWGQKSIEHLQQNLNLLQTVEAYEKLILSLAD